MKHASSRMIFSYWDALRGERAAPERGEIEPGEIRHVLADTFILEIDRDGVAVFRLAGTRICALFGRELKGRTLASLWADPASPEAGREARRAVGIVTDETAGTLLGLTGTTAEGSTVDLELLLLPLRHRGRTHARLLGALSPVIVPPWLGFETVARLTTTSMRVIWPTGQAADGTFGRVPSPEDRRRRFVVHQGGRH